VNVPKQLLVVYKNRVNSMAILHETQLDDTLQAIPHIILHYKSRNQN